MMGETINVVDENGQNVETSYSDHFGLAVDVRF
jgi:hypothetical protein